MDWNQIEIKWAVMARRIRADVQCGKADDAISRAAHRARLRGAKRVVAKQSFRGKRRDHAEAQPVSTLDFQKDPAWASRSHRGFLPKHNGSVARWSPIRADLFGTERLEHHAQTLAEAQDVITGVERRMPRLDSRVKDNAEVLIDAYRACAQALQADRRSPRLRVVVGQLSPC